MANIPMDDRLNTTQRHGLIAVTVCSCMSVVATCGLLLYLSYTQIQRWGMKCKIRSVSGSGGRASREDVNRTQGYFWLINLFIADFLQGIGLTLNTYSISMNAVVPGKGCNAQGFFINTGDLASAWWTFIIAIHTFLVLAGGMKWRAWATEISTKGKVRWLLAAAVWTGSIFLSMIGMTLIQRLHPELGPFYNNTGLGWCWIGDNYFWERIFMHYFFLFFDGFTLPILYCILFVYIRAHAKTLPTTVTTSTHGNQLESWPTNLEAGKAETAVSPNDIMLTTFVKITSEVRPTHHRHEVNKAERTKKRMNHVAIALLCYPFAYLCLTMPIAIVRVAIYCGATFPIAVSYVVVAIYASSGWVNMFLYTILRKGIVSWDRLLWWRIRRIATPSRKSQPVANLGLRSSHYRSISDSRMIIPEAFSIPRSEKLNPDSDSDDTKFEPQQISSTDRPAIPRKAKLNQLWDP